MIKKNKTSVKTFKGKYDTRWFVNTEELHTWEEVKLAYLDLFQFFKENKIKVVYEKTFGDIENLNLLNKIRSQALQETNVSKYPISYTEGSPLYGNVISNITFHGVSGLKETSVVYKYLDQIEEPVAALITNPEDRRLYIHSLATNAFENDIYNETTQVFEIMDKLATENGFKSQDLVRTWIYLDQIYKNYEAFNLSRKEFFKHKDIPFHFDCNDLPASTCIEGRKDTDVTIAIDALYIDKKYSKTTIGRVFNPLQNEAEGDLYQFQPTFSRGIFIDNAYNQEVQISGTASINNKGKTTHIDDPHGQIKETLINVESLLNEKGLNLGHIVQMTCFFKDKAHHKAFAKVVKELDIPDFGNTFVQGKVCRENLLFELDGIAIKTK